MRDLPASVDETIRTLRLFEPRQSILVGVSGGIDSMALLHVLSRLAAKCAWRLVVAHFNHRLRGRASDADEAFVRKSAKSIGLEFVSSRADVNRFARGHKLSVEMGARKLRHAFFARTCVRLGIGSVALAHHADDQVELFFLRLLRGAGGEGLAGMEWISPSPSDPTIRLVRPFLNLRKAELREFAEQQGIAHREDATNVDFDHRRNRIRHELLPLLQTQYQPALAKVIPRVMEIIRAESDFVAEAARAWLAWGEVIALAKRARSVSFHEKKTSHEPIPLTPSLSPTGGEGGRRTGEGESDRSRFEALPVAVQRRIVQLELGRLGVEPEFELIERLRGAAGEIFALNKTLAIWRDERGRLHPRDVTKFHFDPNSIALDLAVKHGHAEFDGLRVAWQIKPWKRGTIWRRRLRGPIEQFDARKVGSPIILRHWRPGDRFQPIGMRAAVKVQDLFTNAKIRRARRHGLVLAATARQEIFWVEGLRISERFKISRRTSLSLEWAWQRDLIRGPKTA